MLHNIVMKLLDLKNNVYATAFFVLLMTLGTFYLVTGLEKKEPDYLLKTGRGNDTFVTFQDTRDLPDYVSRKTDDQRKEMHEWKRKERDFNERGVYPKMSRWDY